MMNEAEKEVVMSEINLESGFLDNGGWIKVYRKILDNPKLHRHPKYLSLWVHLLLYATHTEMRKEFNGENIILKPGQLITGREFLAKQTGISESSIERILKWLETGHQIEQRKSSTSRLITIVNWLKYQPPKHQNGQPADNGWTTTGQPVNNDRTHTRMYKNEDNDKNDKKEEEVPASSSFLKSSESSDPEMLKEDKNLIIQNPNSESPLNIQGNISALLPAPPPDPPDLTDCLQFSKYYDQQLRVNGYKPPSNDMEKDAGYAERTFKDKNMPKEYLTNNKLIEFVQWYINDLKKDGKFVNQGLYMTQLLLDHPRFREEQQAIEAQKQRLQEEQEQKERLLREENELKILPDIIKHTFTILQKTVPHPEEDADESSYYNYINALIDAFSEKSPRKVSMNFSRMNVYEILKRVEKLSSKIQKPVWFVFYVCLMRAIKQAVMANETRITGLMVAAQVVEAEANAEQNDICE